MPPRRPRSHIRYLSATLVLPAYPCAVPVTLLSPLTPIKKGANALYIGLLAPCHP
jgi:hypothetical protein